MALKTERDRETERENHKSTDNVIFQVADNEENQSFSRSLWFNSMHVTDTDKQGLHCKLKVPTSWKITVRRNGCDPKVTTLWKTAAWRSGCGRNITTLQRTTVRRTECFIFRNAMRTLPEWNVCLLFSTWTVIPRHQFGFTVHAVRLFLCYFFHRFRG